VLSLTHLAAMGVDGFNQHADRFRRSKLRDAMAQVKHVAHARFGLAERFQYLDRFGTDLVSPGKQDVRIQVALQGDFMPYSLASRREFDHPVQTKRVRTTFGNVFQPLAAALGEYDTGNAGAVFFPLERGYHLTHVVQGKLLVNAISQRAAPGIEN